MKSNKKEFGMKNYGALRKIMLIVVLSILGSYCIGSTEDKKIEVSSFEYAMKLTYDLFASVGNYCQILWSDLVDTIQSLFGRNKKHDVEIQMIDDEVHGNNEYCTDGQEDCHYNEEFFNDTWFKGTLDADPTTHLDVDVAPMRYVDAHNIPVSA